MTDKSFKSYWIGEDTNYNEIWSDYEEGLDGYSRKFNSMSVYLFRIKFKYPPSNLPLFNHEAIYKTIKGYYHDIKYLCFDRQTFNQMGPLFLYDIRRGSGDWGFLAELPVALLLLWTIRKNISLSMAIKNKDEILKFQKEHFPDASEDVALGFNKIKTSDELDEMTAIAIKELHKQQIEEIKISKIPFSKTKPNEIEKNLIILPSKENDDKD
jgi:hypothetical protein